MPAHHPRRRWPSRLAVVALLATFIAPFAPAPATAAGPSLAGRGEAAGAPMSGASVVLREAGTRQGAPAITLGQATAAADGTFSIEATRPPSAGATTYLTADDPADGPG